MIKSVYFTPRISLSEKKVIDSISRGTKCKVKNHMAFIIQYATYHTWCQLSGLIF